MWYVIVGSLVDQSNSFLFFDWLTRALSTMSEMYQKGSLNDVTMQPSTPSLTDIWISVFCNKLAKFFRSVAWGGGHSTAYQRANSFPLISSTPISFYDDIFVEFTHFWPVFFWMLMKLIRLPYTYYMRYCIILVAVELSWIMHQGDQLRTQMYSMLLGLSSGNSSRLTQ